MTRRTSRSVPIVMLAVVVACPAANLAGPTLPLEVVVPTVTDLPAKSFTETVPGSNVKFDMVYVSGGEFLMGSPEGEPGRKPDEGPRHPVKLRPYWLGRCEVTWNEFDAYTQDAGLFITSDLPPTLRPQFKPDAVTRPTLPFIDETYEHGRDGQPVISITHHAAMVYCHWLRWKTKKAYRLPTEAEWEYACRAGHDGPFGIPAGEKLDNFAWYKANSATRLHISADNGRDPEQPTTHKVGSKKPNKFGLYDMHGNVSEWVLDLYDAKFYGKFPTDMPILGPVNKPADKKWGHVVRGGSFADGPEKLRAAARRESDKSWQRLDPQLPQSIWWLTKMDVIGFRVALPVEEYPDLVGIKPMVEKKLD